MRTRHYYVIASLIVLLYLCYLMCTPGHSGIEGQSIRDPYGKAFAGSAACASCHKDIYKDHILTAHSLDSRPATLATIKGDLDSGKNHFDYPNKIKILLERRGARVFQTASLNGKELRSEPIDIVIGSGRKGQTYLYWKDGQLFELPVSYSTVQNAWCNSPGYPTGSVIWDREASAACLECHTTYARTVFRSNAKGGDFFDPNLIIYGIGCERCHGPGAEHVAFHTANPDETKGRYIIDPKRLSRQQKLDLCALCHSGSRSGLRPPFSFEAGDTLTQFSTTHYSMDSAATLDVHANQYGLLTASKCFRNSQLDCSTCHNVHVNQVNDPKSFSQKCMTCHNQTTHLTCTMKPVQGLVLADNCIDCHMPALPSKNILLTLTDAGKTIPNLVRTHRIAVYTANTKAYLHTLSP